MQTERRLAACRPPPQLPSRSVQIFPLCIIIGLVGSLLDFLINAFALNHPSCSLASLRELRRAEIGLVWASAHRRAGWLTVLPALGASGRHSVPPPPSPSRATMCLRPTTRTNNEPKRLSSSEPTNQPSGVISAPKITRAWFGSRPGWRLVFGFSGERGVGGLLLQVQPKWLDTMRLACTSN